MKPVTRTELILHIANYGYDNLDSTTDGCNTTWTDKEKQQVIAKFEGGIRGGEDKYLIGEV